MLKRPQVLFLGNGINRAFGGVSWDNLLKEICTRDDLDVSKLNSPMPLQAILVTENRIDEVFKGKDINMFGRICTPEQKQALQTYWI